MSKYDYRDFLDNKYYCANVRIREAEVNDILPNPNDVKLLYESFLKAKAFDIIMEYMFVAETKRSGWANRLCMRDYDDDTWCYCKYNAIRSYEFMENSFAEVGISKEQFDLIKQALEVDEE